MRFLPFLIVTRFYPCLAFTNIGAGIYKYRIPYLRQELINKDIHDQSKEQDPEQESNTLRLNNKHNQEGGNSKPYRAINLVTLTVEEINPHTKIVHLIFRLRKEPREDANATFDPESQKRTSKY